MPSWRKCDFTPRIVAAIADGNAPANLTVTGLAKALPYSWAEHHVQGSQCQTGRQAPGAGSRVRRSPQQMGQPVRDRPRRLARRGDREIPRMDRAAARTHGGAARTARQGSCVLVFMLVAKK